MNGTSDLLDLVDLPRGGLTLITLNISFQNVYLSNRSKASLYSQRRKRHMRSTKVAAKKAEWNACLAKCLGRWGRLQQAAAKNGADLGTHLNIFTSRPSQIDLPLNAWQCTVPHEQGPEKHRSQYLWIGRTAHFWFSQCLVRPLPVVVPGKRQFWIHIQKAYAIN